MQVRTAARVLGIVYILVAVIGVIPAISPPAGPDQPHLALPQGFNLVFGLFAVNVLHDIVHLAVGIWGVVAAASYAASKTYWRTVAIVFLVLFVLGIIPSTSTLFGLTPLFGWDAWLHVLTAIVGFYFGWGATETSGDVARAT